MTEKIPLGRRSSTNSSTSSAGSSSLGIGPQSNTSSPPTAPPSSNSPSPTSLTDLKGDGPITGKATGSITTSAADSNHFGGAFIIATHAGIILDTRIAESSIGIVWGGVLIPEGVYHANGRPAEHIRIAVKLVDWERDSEKEEGTISGDGQAILKEAEVYEYLANMAPESHITPKYYGVFNCSGAIALILEDGGERLPQESLEKLKDIEKHYLFEMAQQLHNLGIKHNDLSSHNILIDTTGKLSIIDFRNAQLGHHCPGPFACDELQEFATRIKLSM
ncbi:hypothetical protein GYMLUDRAFT_380335 [Collybiopsis luxurians FD-317 M1]|nr:hypothetical protein GYMLUDRAFT_380335 [Collybiopsis luxurians FD-317 M1]